MSYEGGLERWEADTEAQPLGHSLGWAGQAGQTSLISMASCPAGAVEGARPGLKNRRQMNWAAPAWLWAWPGHPPRPQYPGL